MRTRVLAGVVAAITLGCASPGAPPAAVSTANAVPCDRTFGAPASFAIEKADLRARGASAQLVSDLEASAYRYFRALGAQFALRTCAEFRDVKAQLPVVAIHGDPHVEQFVVTGATSGLEDFDQSGYGPMVVDLVRYAASLHLACREVSWKCDADAAVAAYFAAYRDALDRPPTRTAPAVVERLRGAGARTPEEWLTWAESLMRPLTPQQERYARQGWETFRGSVSAIRPERPREFFDVVKMGALVIGVGSGLETKVLVRARGPSDAPADDVVIEARSTARVIGGECPWRPLHGGSLQPLMFMALLGPRLPEVHGWVSLDDVPNTPDFWLQSWDRGYRELALADLRGQSDLIELAQDGARQLAGHFWSRFPEQLRPVQRHAQLRAFDLVAARARAMSRAFADETVLEWNRFRR